jgi:hypothetical protein
VHALKLTAEQFAALSGKWQGKLDVTTPDGQKRSFTIVLRFETNANGQFVGFLDSPDQGSKGISINEFTLVDGKVNAKVEVARLDLTGSLAGKTLTLQWKQGPIDAPLTLTRQ